MRGRHIMLPRGRLSAVVPTADKPLSCRWKCACVRVANCDVVSSCGQPDLGASSDTTYISPADSVGGIHRAETAQRLKWRGGKNNLQTWFEFFIFFFLYHSTNFFLLPKARLMAWTCNEGRTAKDAEVGGRKAGGRAKRLIDVVKEDMEWVGFREDEADDWLRPPPLEGGSYHYQY